MILSLLKSLSDRILPVEKGPDESLVDDRLTWSGIASAKIPSVEQRYFHGLRPPRRDRKQGGHNRTRSCSSYRNKVIPVAARQQRPARDRNSLNARHAPQAVRDLIPHHSRLALLRHHVQQQQIVRGKPQRLIRQALKGPYEKP